MGQFAEQQDRSNGYRKNQPPEGLRVIIVGGGLGGMSAAIALRQQGHSVDVYESSGFVKETGAAIHTAPNANAVLKGLGVSCKDIGANILTWMSAWTPNGERVKKTDLLAETEMYDHSYRLAHRARLHEELKKLATDDSGAGRPANLHLSKPVQDVNTAEGIVYFKDGTSVQGDVVIGADGVRSVTRTKLPGGDIQPFASGLSAFRFLIPRELVFSDLRTRKFVETDGEMHGVFGKDRSLIIYPTSDNMILNFVCIHPDTRSESTESWGNSVTLSELCEVYRDFHSDFLALFEKLDESSLKVWKLLDMKPLQSWCHGRLAVLGDAAHPFLPFLGQGGAVAIEDAVALGTIIEADTKKDEITERLALYQQVRKERAEMIQQYTRLSGKSRGESKSFDMKEYQAYCFGHDEWQNSAQKLKEWKSARKAKS